MNRLLGHLKRIRREVDLLEGSYEIPELALTVKRETMPMLVDAMREYAEANGERWTPEDEAALWALWAENNPHLAEAES